MEELSTRRTGGSDEDFRMLVEELDKELWERYPDSQQNYVQWNILPEDVLVILIEVNAVPGGCGCLRQYDDQSYELKRMFVQKEFRGMGIGKRILTELERWSEERGITRIILETGHNQPEAIALYKKTGYRIIENYGNYVDNEESVCMEKQWDQC